MTWKPHVTVAAVIEHRQRFLCVEETIEGQRKLNQPAGHLEPGETLVDAVKREMLEETRFEFTPERVVGIYLWRKDADSPTFLRVTFTGQLGREHDHLEYDKDIDGIAWLTREELQLRQHEWRSPLVGRTVDDHIKGQRYPLDLLVDVL